MKKVWVFLKKFWWLLLAIFAFILGLFFSKGKKNPDVSLLEEQRQELKKEQEELKKEQEKLEREAEEIEKKRYFNDPVDAANYINNELRKRK
jgi:cell division protein FtsB